MKKLLFLLTVCLSTISFGQALNGAKIEFKKETHDYGNIKYGANGECTFEFTNTGNAPLIISEAKGSCGCTVPEKPKRPIAPGDEGIIKATFDSKNRVGSNHKVLTAIINTESRTQQLVFDVEVVPSK